MPPAHVVLVRNISVATVNQSKSNSAKSAYSALQDVVPRSKLRRSLGEVANALLE